MIADPSSSLPSLPLNLTPTLPGSIVRHVANFPRLRTSRVISLFQVAWQLAGPPPPHQSKAHYNLDDCRSIRLSLAICVFCYKPSDDIRRDPFSHQFNRREFHGHSHRRLPVLSLLFSPLPSCSHRCGGASSSHRPLSPRSSNKM